MGRCEILADLFAGVLQGLGSLLLGGCASRLTYHSKKSRMRDTSRRPIASASAPSATGTTRIGNGWLRESREVNAKWRGGKSALRNCMMMPIPDELRGLLAQSPLLPSPPYHPLRAEDVVPHARNPRRDVREFAAFTPRQPPPPVPSPRSYASRAPTAWWEDPFALGTLLILLPPIGLAAVWSSARYSRDARWALTVMTALMMCLVATVIITLNLR